MLVWLDWLDPLNCLDWLDPLGGLDSVCWCSALGKFPRNIVTRCALGTFAWRVNTGRLGGPTMAWKVSIWGLDFCVGVWSAIGPDGTHGKPLGTPKRAQGSQKVPAGLGQMQPGVTQISKNHPLGSST